MYVGLYMYDVVELYVEYSVCRFMSLVNTNYVYLVQCLY